MGSIASKLNRFPKLSFHHKVNLMGKFLNTENKSILRQQVILVNFSGHIETLTCILVPKQFHITHRGTKHNKLYCGLLQNNIIKCMSKEIPIESVISLFKIHLDSHPTFLLFLSFHRVHNFLCYNYVIITVSPEYKTAPIWVNKETHVRFNTISYHSRDDLIDDIR